MKVSIVIPVYNVEQYIEDCLNSVVAQTYKGEIECIIVDDCTPDNSCAIIERFIKQYTGNIDFKLLHHAINRGLSAARNTGIDAATGDYVYFLDSDDEITPDSIELLAAPLKNKKDDFVIGDYETIGSDAQFPPLLLVQGAVLTNEDIRDSYFKNLWYMMAWNKLCNLGFIRKKGLYFNEGIINEDEIWSFQMACTSQSMYVVPLKTYIYKVRVTSIIGMQDMPSKAITLSRITTIIYDWSKDRGIIYDKGVLKKVLYYREHAIKIIFSQETSSQRRRLYLECYRLLRIAPWQAYRNKAIKGTSLVKEFYNILPGMIGYYFLKSYNKILGR